MFCLISKCLNLFVFAITVDELSGQQASWLATLYDVGAIIGMAGCRSCVCTVYWCYWPYCARMQIR